MTKLAATVLLVVATTFGAACASNNKVGSNSVVDFKDQAQNELGKRTTTTQAGAHPVTTAAPTTAPPTTRPAQQKVSPVTQAPTRTDSTFTIAIYGDTGDVTGFDPPSAAVVVGTTVVWVNRDTQARSVVDDKGTFESGSIAPGASFSRKFTAAARFNYADGTRPYTVGLLEVRP
jgi:plastocyanin